jgi:hypothetical protein
MPEHGDMQEIRSKIEQAIEAAKARGIKIITDEWNASPDRNRKEFAITAEAGVSGVLCCCALAAVALDKPSPPSVENCWDEEGDWVGNEMFDDPYDVTLTVAKRELGVGETFAVSFIRGFDGDPVTQEVAFLEAYQLGVDIRRKYADEVD